MTSDTVPVVIRRDIVVVYFGGSKCLEMIFGCVYISEILRALSGVSGYLVDLIGNGVPWVCLHDCRSEFVWICEKQVHMSGVGNSWNVCSVPITEIV